MRTSTFDLDTGSSTVIDITDAVERFVAGSGNGLVNVFAPHATAGVVREHYAAAANAAVRELAIDRGRDAERYLAAAEAAAQVESGCCGSGSGCRTSTSTRRTASTNTVGPPSSERANRKPTTRQWSSRNDPVRLCVPQLPLPLQLLIVGGAPHRRDSGRGSLSVVL